MRGRLSVDERANARRALLFLAERSAPAQLAEALGLTPTALERARSPSRPPTLRLAALVATVAGVRLTDVLTGAWPGDLCPRCGRGSCIAQATADDEDSRRLATVGGAS
jgi:transcriptional regulator with XRE-family HTH domain